jgi:hypothetical protein
MIKHSYWPHSYNGGIFRIGCVLKFRSVDYLAGIYACARNKACFRIKVFANVDIPEGCIETSHFIFKVCSGGGFVAGIKGIE